MSENEDKLQRSSSEDKDPYGINNPGDYDYEPEVNKRMGVGCVILLLGVVVMFLVWFIGTLI